MRVLVTRPEPDAERLAEALRARGHEPVLCPLMTIEPSEGAPPNVDKAVLLFTSANGVRAAARRGIKPSRGVLVVGPTTAAAAQEVGFAVAGIAGGDVESLAKLARQRAKDERLVHVAGSDLAGDLKGALEAAGFKAERWIAYRARAEATLPAPARAFLNGPPGAVTLFSVRTARILAGLMALAGVTETARSHLALCLSPAVAQAASAAPWGELRIAARPEQAALVALLD